MLNNSGSAVFPGDFLEWTFYNSNMTKKKGGGMTSAKDVRSLSATRGTGAPRRIAIKIATASSERIIGRCLSFAKSGETFDLMLKSC